MTSATEMDGAHGTRSPRRHEETEPHGKDIRAEPAEIAERSATH
jgi:hypothetical protein